MRFTYSRSVAFLSLLIAAACGGDESPTNPADADGGTRNGGTSDGGSQSGSGASSGGSSGTQPGNVANAVSLGSLRAPYARLGIIGSRTAAAEPLDWLLRLYPAGPSRASTGTCGAVARIGECQVEDCDIDSLDAGVSSDDRWSGTVTVTDETAGTVVTANLDDRSGSVSAVLVIDLALPATIAGNTVHVVAAGVTGMPPVDVRAVVPDEAQIELAGALHTTTATPYAHGPRPGALRVDLSSLEPGGRRAVCFFDRASSALALPPLQDLGLGCAQAPFVLVPVGQAMTVVENPSGPQALVYLAVGSTASALAPTPCD